MNITQEELDQFEWYHKIEVAPGVYTKNKHTFQHSWSLIQSAMDGYNFSGKSVLDVGTRDVKWAFMAESRGASRVDAFDNDLSNGAKFLAERLNSSVKFSQANLYSTEYSSEFDVVLFLGVLYHLRYPFLGIKKVVDATKIGGTIFIETGMHFRSETDDIPLVYCPVYNNPYEPSSCSFFNRVGLNVTMESFGCKPTSFATDPKESGMAQKPGCTKTKVRRAMLIYKKESNMEERLDKYWNRTHNFHSGKVQF